MRFEKNREAMLEDVTRTSPVAGGLRIQDMTAKSLDDLLVVCIDEALIDLLGSRVREAIYDYLERNHSLSRSEIPKHLNIFLGLLTETFGTGSKIIGNAIIKRLYEKLEWKFESNPEFEFMDYLDAVRARIAQALLDHAKNGAASR